MKKENEIEKEIISKSGFVFYVDYWEKYFSKMSGDQIKEVLNIVFCFNKTFEVTSTDDLAVDVVATTIIDNIKRDATKRKKQYSASKENGKRGGRPSKSECIAKDRKASLGDNSESLKSQEVAKDNSKKEKFYKKKNFEKPTYEEIKNYCSNKSYSVDAELFFDFYESKGWKVGSSAMKDWKAAVRTWQKKNNNQTKSNYGKSQSEQISEAIARIESL